MISYKYRLLQDDNSEIGPDEGGEGGMMPSRFYHLVTQLSNSREVIARFKAMAPIKQNKGEKRSLKYGQFRRGKPIKPFR